jgi:hypothetical protein
MKNIISNGRLSYSFTPRIHSNVRVWVQPASASERSRRSIESSLRWEDDGGPASETGSPLPQEAETNTPQRKDAPASYLLEDK